MSKHNGGDYVTGPSKSTLDAISTWGDANGTTLQNTNVIINQSGDITTQSQIECASCNITNPGDKSLILQGSPDQTVPELTLTFPQNLGVAGQVLTTDGVNGNLTWSTAAGGGNVIGPSGGTFPNRIAIWADDTGTALANSFVLIGTDGKGGDPENIQTSGTITGSTIQATEVLQLGSYKGSDLYLSAGPNMKNEVLLSFPIDTGTKGQILQTSGNIATQNTGMMEAELSWVDQAAASGVLQLDFYTTAGDATWHKNPRAKLIQVIMIGGGGGGAGGYAEPVIGGGSFGGGGGAYLESPILPADQFDDAVNITVGDGGNGGKAIAVWDTWNISILGKDGGSSKFGEPSNFISFIVGGGSGGNHYSNPDSINPIAPIVTAGWPNIPSNQGMTGAYYTSTGLVAAGNSFGFSGSGGGAGGHYASPNGTEGGSAKNNISGPNYSPNWTSGNKIIGGSGGDGGYSTPGFNSTPGDIGGRFGGGGGGGGGGGPFTGAADGGKGGAGMVMVYQW